MLIAEDLLLLLTDDANGHQMAGGNGAYLLAGALLTDLAAGGNVRITEAGETDVRAKRLVVDPHVPPPRNPLLLGYLQVLAQKPSWRPAAVVAKFARAQLVNVLYERLVRAELVYRDERKALGFIPYTRFPAAPGSHEAQIRRNIDVALFTDGDTDFQTAALIALLSAGPRTLRVLAQGRELDMWAVKRRAKVLRDQYWAAKAAYDAIQEAAASSAAASAGVG